MVPNRLLRICHAYPTLNSNSNLKILLNHEKNHTVAGMILFILIAYVRCRIRPARHASQSSATQFKIQNYGADSQRMKIANC